MKRVYILLLFSTNFICTNIVAQPFVLDGAWKINFEDKKEFSQALINDTGWADITALIWSDQHKTTANRTLWIRKVVVIPSSLKSEFRETGLLTLSMGKILQSDDTYLNGKRIGSTGSGDTYRNYLVSADDILWDKENTIAIRVSHWGSFKVSIVPKFVRAAPASLFTYAAKVHNADLKAPVPNKTLPYQLSIINQSPKRFEGLLKADFYNFLGSKLYSTEKTVTLISGKNDFEFPYKSSAPFLKIVFTFSVPSRNYTMEWNAEFGYENIIYNTTKPVIAYKSVQQFHSSNLEDIVVNGWLGDRLQSNIQQRLLKVDEDALLAGYVNRPGSHSWIGEHVGKFLEAACNAYANSSDPALKLKIDRTAQHLIAAQLPDGYLGTYDSTSHWTSWDVWSHRYNLMGLLRYYELSGFKPALNSCEKIGDLIIQTFGIGEGQRDIVRAGGHVGMAATCILESMTELYRYTGKKKYLDYCYFLIKSFDNPRGPAILSTLNAAGRVDKVANAKAYEMMSNFLGIIKLYRITNDEQFLKPLELAWNDIVSNRLYITGTSSSFEHFQDNHLLPATENDNMGEGCVTTTWVQFTYELFCITGEMKYLDELERSVYNHLTGAENPQTGAVSYYTPLIGKKPFRTVITCCMSSVPRGIAMIPLFANGKLNNNPSFLFYQPGVYSTIVANNKISFSTTGDFLKGDKVLITVTDAYNASFPLVLRKPYWSGNFLVFINGVEQAQTDSDKITIQRAWQKGDKVEISFTLPAIVLEGGKSYPNHIALQRGPQVLSFDKDINDISGDNVAIDATNIRLKYSKETLPNNWVGNGKFLLKAKLNNIERDISLVPYADAGQTGGIISTWLKQYIRHEQ